MMINIRNLNLPNMLILIISFPMSSIFNRFQVLIVNNEVLFKKNTDFRIYCWKPVDYRIIIMMMTGSVITNQKK